MKNMNYKIVTRSPEAFRHLLGQRTNMTAELGLVVHALLEVGNG